jgi:hypothetical protein
MARIEASSRRDEFTGDIVGVCRQLFDKRMGFEFDITSASTKMDLVLRTRAGYDMTL